MKITLNFNFLRKFLLLGLFVSVLYSSTFAVQLATWNFAGWNPTKVAKTTAPTTTTNANVTVSNMTMGAGIDSSPNYFSDNSFSGLQVAATTLAQAITNNEYYEFTIQPTALKFLTVSSIDVSAVSQGLVRSFSLLSSKNGFTAANAISTITTGAGNESNIAIQTLAVTGHADLSTAVTFRVYIYGVSDGTYSAMGFGLHAAPATSDFVVNGTSQQEDLFPPTMPGSLATSSVGASSLRLNWTVSTDDNGVTGYDVYNGTTLLGTTTKLFYTVSGLTAETNYTFNVYARDLSGKTSTAATVAVKTAVAGTAGDVPKLPIGMNLPSVNYYSPALPFTDAMLSAGEMFSTNSSEWDSNKISEFTRDANGYPTVVPKTTSDGKSSYVRILLNDYYSGRYVLTFTGVGTVSISGVPASKVNNNKYYIDFDGQGQNVWLDITQSTSGNYLKDFKILPLAYDGLSYPTFNPIYLDGLRPFHAFRFMDWINTNHSTQTTWASRITKTYYTQASAKGVSYEYAIELCNELDADAWVTIPHAADDNFITQAARLWRDGLKPTLKVYSEYSNEIWNWMFTQAGYIVDNAPLHGNSYVSTDLAAIQSGGGDFPEKDAYMMARNFRLWKAEFTGVNNTRLVRAAAVQHGWMDNTRRILNYLFDVDGAGCDVVSPGGYFNFGKASHDNWLSRCGTSNPVTPAEVVQGASTYYDTNEALWTDETARFASERGVGYVVYEGGQHMQPWEQTDWCYNQAVYDAQITSNMYDMYMKNFRKMTEPEINCSLFMAFAYMGSRENKYGSWGHLEGMSQIGNPGGYMAIAPKYQALLDANTAKPGPIADTAAPTTPTGLAKGTVTSASVVLNWNASVNAVGVTTYDVYKGVTLAGSTNSTTYTVTGLTGSTLYSFTVVARDGFGSATATSAVSATTTAPVLDITAPTVPSGLSAASVSENSLTLNWTASTDAVGVTEYDVYRGATLIGSPATNSLAVSGLTPATSYSFTVKAKDAANNISAASTALVVSTTATLVVNKVYTEGEATPATVSSTDLLQTSASLTASFGSFDGESTGGIACLTNGNALLGDVNRAGIGSGASLTYTFTNSAAGYIITGIDIYSTWANNGRTTPNVAVSYSLKETPTTFVPMTTATFTPINVYHAAGVWTKSALSTSNSLGVAALKFDFPNQQNGYVGYNEIDVFGTLKVVTTDNKVRSAENVQLFPNPATDKLSFNLGAEFKTISINVLDLQGRSMISQNATNTQVESLDISQLNKGVYFVKVIADGKVMNSKFVKK